jgi:hypothetical protein
VPADTEKIKKQRKIEQARFARLFPFTPDTLHIILKGHLLIEEQLTQLISAGLPYPSPISKLRLSFFQKLGLAKAVAGKFLDKDIYAAIKQINSIRNTLAHEVEPANVDELVMKLIEQYEDTKLFTHVSSLPNNMLKLYTIIQTCWIATATYKEIITVVNEIGSITHAISKDS